MRPLFHFRSLARGTAFGLALVVAMMRPARAAESTLRLEFRPVIDATSLAIASDKTPGPAVITRLDWLVSGLSLQKADGSWMPAADWFGYVSTGENRLQVDATGVPAESFRAIRFRVGVGGLLDAADPAQWPPDHALNPDVNHLHWGWLGGYIYLAVEGRWRTKAGEPPAAFSYHLAGADEPMWVELPVEFRGGSPATIAIQFDVGKLLAGVDPVHGANSTHSRPGDLLAVQMKKNAVAAFKVVSVRADLLQPASAPATAAAAVSAPAGTHPYRVEVTDRFPKVQLPLDNPLTAEGVALGRRLFHEPRLSQDNAQSCASCHQQEHAFADPRRFSLGADGRKGTRNAMALFNLAWAGAFFWDGRAKTIHEQIRVPIQDAREMNERLDRAVAKLTQDKTYPAQFAAAFGSPGITEDRLGQALEQFLLTLVSQESRFDRAVRKLDVLSESEKRGLQLFVTEYDPARGQRGADCFHCHGGTLFTDNQFHDNGLELAPSDIGYMNVTGLESDRGKFKAPSLRNVAVTAPYMHDGRFATLEEVVDHYDSGVVRNPNLDPNIAKHPAAGLQLSAQDKQDLVAFLKTLTDEPFIHPPDSEPVP